MPLLQVANGYRPAFNNTVPAQVNEIIEKCWKGGPGMRPTAGQVVGDLEAVLASGRARLDAPIMSCYLAYHMNVEVLHRWDSTSVFPCDCGVCRRVWHRGDGSVQGLLHPHVSKVQGNTD
jgi:hypothetical protein